MTTALSALLGFFILSAASAAEPAWASSPTAAPIIHAPLYEVTMTGYNAIPSQTDGDPLITASGAYSNPEIVAARSQDLADQLPFGTVIAIEPSDTSDPNCGYPVVANRVGLRVIADVMNARIHNGVDLLFGTHDTVTLADREVNAARAFGVCSKVTVIVVGHIDVQHLPKTQDELAQLITGNGPELASAK